MKDFHSELLMVSYLDYPYHAGLSQRITGIARVLLMNGIKVKIMSPIARAGSLINDTHKGGFIVQRIDLRRFRSKDSERFATKFIQWLLFSLLASIQVVNSFAKTRCLIQYQSVYSFLPALVAKLLLRARIIGDDIVLVHPLVDIPILKFTDVVVTPSLSAYSFAKQLQRFTLYVPNGVEPKLSRRSTLESKSTIIFVGALSFDQNLKAVEKLLMIASDLDNRGQIFNFLIVGGPLNRVEYLAKHPLVKKGKIKFVGRVSRDELEEFYNHSFIGILPFFQDTPLRGGQRTKALEFFAKGLLVISGPEGVKGIRNLQPGRHYLLANSVNEMCELVHKCLVNPERYSDIAIAGNEFIAENYSWERLTKHYISFIQDLIHQKY